MKINLYVNQELSDKLEPFKDKINLSEVFADALQNILQGMSTEVDDLYNRLILEKNYVFNQGVSDGMTAAGYWIEDAALNDIIKNSEEFSFDIDDEFHPRGKFDPDSPNMEDVPYEPWAAGYCKGFQQRIRDIYSKLKAKGL